MVEFSHRLLPGETAIYCPACNARFLHKVIAGICPRCGGEVLPDEDVSLAETMLFRDNLADSTTGFFEPPSSGSEPAPPTDLDQLVGGTLHVYRCDHLLGRGGMGRVYLAHHADLDRKCALKILSPRAVESDVDYVARFRLEGRAAAALVHPNIITIHAIGEERGFHFLEMEFVAGRSLQRLLDDEGLQTPLRATNIAQRIAEALSAAHQHGIIHRDLKLDNVLLTHQGVPKIADFGLAKRVRASDGFGPGRLIGTPHYMAPEIFDGEEASPATDVYALGVCYFVLLTGRLPFPARSLSELSRLAATAPLPDVRQINPRISLEMSECLNVLMARSAANRARSAVEAAQLLNAVAGDIPEIEALLRDAFGSVHHVRWRRHGEQFHVEVQLPSGRCQTVIVERSRHAAAERLVTLTSICGPAHAKHLEQALRINSELAHGSLAVRDIEGRPTFVMVNTYPETTVDVEEIHKSVLELAHRGDAFEMLLSNKDQH